MYGLAEVCVFGSTAEDKPTANSDIDIAIVIEEILKRELERAKLIDKL